METNCSRWGSPLCPLVPRAWGGEPLSPVVPARQDRGSLDDQAIKSGTPSTASPLKAPKPPVSRTIHNLYSPILELLSLLSLFCLFFDPEPRR